MTGPNRSPSTPWSGDSQSYQPTGSPTSTTVLPLCGSPLKEDNHQQNLGTGRLTPGYFGIPSMKQGFSKDWNALSQLQSSVSSPKVHVLSRNASFGDYMNLSRETPALDKEATHVQRSESDSGLSAALPSHSKSIPYHPGELIRSHKMTVFWKENQDGQVHQNIAVSKSSRALASPSVYPASSGIVSHITRAAPVSTLTDRSGTMISPARCAELLQSSQRIMLLDVRPHAHFAQAAIKGSLNLCIPTTLLKRRSFDIRKLEATFTDEAEKGIFAQWKHCNYIVVYDASTTDMKDATPLLNVLTKFTVEGWTGEGLILSGGFKAFSDSFPSMIRWRPEEPGSRNLVGSGLPSVAPVVGGCSLPESVTAAIPFFGNIRQNRDLLCGVGQMALKLPEQLTESRRKRLPSWLRAASDPQDEGLQVSMKFLNLEQRELERMREALSYDKTPESTASGLSKRFRIAGIEKGAKNRYTDIYPFDHSRVRLQNVPAGGCDYVNANHIKSGYTDKSYIATQAPVPDTFNDFWRVVWEQNVKVIVSLTAEIEQGQVKCHPFWNTGDYGPLQVQNLTKRRIRLRSDTRHTPGILRPTQDAGVDQHTNEGDDPCIIVRHLSLSHAAFPFQPLREITQLHYPYWPDFGRAAQPSHLIELIEQCDRAVKASNTTTGSQGTAPMLVHCSAGCGRTGTFCTVDSILDMMKRRQGAGPDPHEETLDPIAQTVEEFRMQRPSMVQNLSQFVLCYESVLEWMVARMAEEAND